MQKGIADIMFILDTSGSMSPIFDYLADNIDKFVENLKSDAQGIGQWDLRIGIVAGDNSSIFLFPFTKDISSFRNQITNIKKNRAGGNELMPWLMDISLVDIEWRTDARRIMIVLTDEPLSGNHASGFLKNGLQELISRLAQFKVLLYYISPKCNDYKNFGIIPKSFVYFITDKNELTNISKLDYIFSQINSSISASFGIQMQQALLTKFDEYVYKWSETEKAEMKLFK